MSFVANSLFSCTAIVGNTGAPKCAVDFGAWVGHYLAPLTVGLTQAEVDDFKATLQAKCILNDPLLRWRKGVADIYDDLQDASDDATETELGNFRKKKHTDPGTTGYIAGVTAGGLEFLHKMMDFNGKTTEWGIVEVDEHGQARMRYNSADGLYYPMKMTTYYWAHPKTKIPGEERKFFCTIRFANDEQLTEEARCIQTGNADLVNDIQSVNDVDIVDVSNGLAAGIFDVIPYDYSVNMASTLGSTLNSTTIWKAKIKSSGADLTISSVASTTVGGKAAVKLTLSTGDTDYALADTAVIYWANVSTVAGVSPTTLSYYESNSSNQSFTSGQLEVELT